MKKRIIVAIIVLCLFISFLPTFTLASVNPYFVVTNDTLLPFNDSNMPFISGGEVFLSERVFEGVGVWSTSSVDLERVRLYRGSRFVDFYTASGETQDQDGNLLNWPSARRVGRRFYVPVRQVCEYFGLTYQVIEVPYNVIPDERMRVIRVVSSSSVSGTAFIGLNERALRTAYNEYYAPPTPPTPTTPTPPSEEEPDEPALDNKTITVFLSFYDVSAGSANGILDLLDNQIIPDYHSCFFVSASDIINNPGLVRRISGSGHMIGIWLPGGTYQEYLETSALLFEAAKLRTVLVSADEAAETAIKTADEHGLIYWDGTQSIADDDTPSASTIIAMLPGDNGARQSFVFSCSENAAAVLPGLSTHLRTNEYMVAGITETIEPIG